MEHMDHVGRITVNTGRLSGLMPLRSTAFGTIHTIENPAEHIYGFSGKFCFFNRHTFTFRRTASLCLAHMCAVHAGLRTNFRIRHNGQHHARRFLDPFIETPFLSDDQSNLLCDRVGDFETLKLQPDVPIEVLAMRRGAE